MDATDLVEAEEAGEEADSKAGDLAQQAQVATDAHAVLLPTTTTTEVGETPSATRERSGKRRKGDAFNRAEGNANAGDVLLDWRVERIVLLGKNVARCFGLRDVPFLAEIRIYGRRFLIFPHPSGTNRWWNERRNERRARQVLQRFLRGETVLGRGGRQGRPARPRGRSGY